MHSTGQHDRGLGVARPVASGRRRRESRHRYRSAHTRARGLHPPAGCRARPRRNGSTARQASRRKRLGRSGIASPAGDRGARLSRLAGSRPAARGERLPRRRSTQRARRAGGELRSRSDGCRRSRRTRPRPVGDLRQEQPGRKSAAVHAPRQRRHTGSSTIEAGPYGYRGASVSGGGRTGGIDGYLLARLSDETGWRDATSARTRMLFANVGRKRDSSDVALTAMYANDSISEAGSLPESWLAIDPRPNYTPGDYFRPDLFHVALRGMRQMTEGQLSGNLFLRRNDYEQYNGNVPPPNSDGFVRNRSAGGLAEWSRVGNALGVNATVTTGLEYTRSDVGYSFFAVAKPGAIADSASLADLGCVVASGLCTHVATTEHNAAAYVQLIASLTDALSVTAAVRGDYVRLAVTDLLTPSDGGTNVFWRASPKVGIDYRASNSLCIREREQRISRTRAAGADVRGCGGARCSLSHSVPTRRCARLGDGLRGRCFRRARLAKSCRPHLVPFGCARRHSLRPTDRDNRLFSKRRADTTSGRRNIGVIIIFARDQCLRVILVCRGDVWHTDAHRFGSRRRAGDGTGRRLSDVPATPCDSRAGARARHVTREVDGAIEIHGVSSQYLRGDEANVRPPLPGFATTDVRLSARPHARPCVRR